MARTVGVDSIESAFAAIVEDYKRELDDSLRSDLQYVGEFTANEIHRSSPVGQGIYYSRKKNGEGGYTKVRRSGKHYNAGWDYAFETDGYGGLSVVVHNTTKPSLTHLLEKGHMNVDGSWTSAREHIEPAYERGAELLERRLRNG